MSEILLEESPLESQGEACFDVETGIHFLIKKQIAVEILDFDITKEGVTR